jgi:arylsulfatase A-like enzyme
MDLSKESQQPPNIFLIITDNQRLDTLGVMNQTPCRTPTWDRVAGEGVLLDHMRTTSPVCSPARASLFTSLQPHQAGMPTIGFDYAENDDGSGGQAAPRLTGAPLVARLREGGYETVYVGKWHLGENNVHDWFDRTAATDQAFRDYSEWCNLHGLPDGYIFHDPDRAKPFRSKHYPHMSIPRTGVFDLPDDKEHNFWLLGHAFEQLAVRSGDRPLFMTLSFEGPHPPLVVPRAYFDMYDPADVVEPPNWGPMVGEPSFMADSYYRKQWREFGEDFDTWRKSWAVYWGYATYIDSLCGRFLDRCAEKGLLENALVIMISDHGEMLGQHGLNQKMSPYDPNIRVPCAISRTGVVPAGSRCRMDTSLVDMAPTILAAAGRDPDSIESEGEDLLPYFGGEIAEPISRDCFAQWNMTPFEQTWHGVEPWRLIVRRPWKYVLHENGEAELFHLDDDPHETVNLCGNEESRGIEAELKDALLAWAGRTGDPFAERAVAD